MRISVNWLRELVKTDLSPEALGELLTMAGLEVEEIEDRRTWADGVVIGKILDRQPHPNADKLSVCTVDIGADNPSTIVCGAPNAQADIWVAVATLGTYLPKVDLKIKPAKLRGVASEGMICSLAELGLEKESAGIHIFPESNLTLGKDVRPLLGLDDVILDISPTANRGDALSMIGVAREVAALTGATLNLPNIPPVTPKNKKPSLKIQVTDKVACPLYVGTVVKGVKIAPSPLWLQRRLQAGGIRPINNVVDVTNYILLEWGQPLHAFDQERLTQVAQSPNLQLGVRFAQAGESLKTLDEQRRELKEANLLITVNEQPIALAGVMGGAETEVHSGTQNLVLETALFDPLVIRRSAKTQNLRSESSSRYEKGVNPVELDLARGRAIALILEVAGGEVEEQLQVDNRPSQAERVIELRLERVQQVLGEVARETGTSPLLPAEVERILSALNCEVQTLSPEPQVWLVKVPSYRYRDLEREIDLIEEVARLYGYDRFCDTLPAKTLAGGLSLGEQAQRRIREAFRAVGLTELVQYSLVKPEKGEITLVNPLFAEYSALRSNLLDGLITAFAYNQAQGNGALNGFEIGRIFWETAEGLAEADALGGILGGELSPAGVWTRSNKAEPMTWYEAKGLLESVFQRLGVEVSFSTKNDDPRLHPGRTASLELGGKPLGFFGQLHPQLRQDLDLMEAVYAFELSLEVLLAALEQPDKITPHFQAFSTYPGVSRDLALFAPVDLSLAQLEQVIRKAGGNLLERVMVFDEYRGTNVPEGQRSLAFSLIYRQSDRTLTDADVEPVQEKIRQALSTAFPVTLRS
jgi:phenylalanyl-tRNA synthetase beta chain